MATLLREAKGLANRLVIRLCARLREPDRLSEVIFSTAIAFTVAGAGMCVMSQFEKLHPASILREYDISFELNVPQIEVKQTTPKDKIATAQVRPQPVIRQRAKTETRTVKTVTSAQLTSNVSVDTEPANPAKPAAPPPPVAIISSPDAANAAPLPVQEPIASPGAANAVTTSGDSTGAGSNNTNTSTSDSTPVVKPQADLNAVAGADFGAQKTIAMAAAAPRMGNIKPYRQDLLARLARNWKPRKGYDRIVLMLTISKEGKVLGDEIVESSGSDKVDREALTAIEETEFAPLPDWYKGDHLTWKLDLSTIFGG